MNKEIAQVQYGYKMNLIKTPRSSKPQNLIWNNEIESILSVRNINLINTTNDQQLITNNCIIIDKVA